MILIQRVDGQKISPLESNKQGKVNYHQELIKQNNAQKKNSL